MPKADIIDILPRDQIRDMAEQRAEFLSVIGELSPHQLAQTSVVLHALRPVLPDTASSGPDGELIRLCDRLCDIHAAITAVYEAVPDGENRDTITGQLNAKWFEIADRIFELGEPTTPEGARASAVVLLDQHRDGLDEAIKARNLSDFLAIRCAEYLAR